MQLCLIRWSCCKSARAVRLKGRANRGFKDGGNCHIVVGNGVDVVEREIVCVINVALRLITGEESPAAVEIIARILAIAIANRLPIDSDSISSDARPVADCNGLDEIGCEAEILMGHNT